MSIRHAIPVSLLLFVLTFASCGGSVKELDGALGAIPIISPASLKERTTAHTSDVISDPTKFSTYTWHLETASSPADVETYYATQWPSAGRSEDDGEVTLRNPPLPEGEAPLGEGVSVTIKSAPEAGKTQFSITEDVFSRRRP